MSCHYPSCGDSGCYKQNTCQKEYDKKHEEKRLLDLEEQKARIAYYKSNTPDTSKKKITRLR